MKLQIRLKTRKMKNEIKKEGLKKRKRKDEMK